MAQDRRQAPPSGPAAREGVPSFQLYGEAPRLGLPDIVHIETLKDRSRLHDWEIRPHRHADLCQIMCFETMDVGVELDGRALRTDGPALLFVPPQVVHGFRFSPQILGTVTTIPVEAVAAADPELTAGARPALITAEAAAFAPLRRLLAELEDEYRADRQGRVRAIASLIDLALLSVRRALAEGAQASARRGETMAERRVGAFLRLVERRYAEGWDVAAYAREVGVSKPQLARDCRAVAGRSPLDLIHTRIIKEANRKLAYTPWPISQIALALGFSDLAYFSRFYSARTGAAPSRYRSEIRARRRL